MSTAFLFPGQGSQEVGMLRAVPTQYIERIKKITGYQLEDLPENYEDTVFIQLALLVKGLSALAAVQRNEIRPDLVAGHSLGAFCAAVACKAITFDDAVRIVYQRAVLMKAAYPTGYAMGVIVGLTRTEVAQVVQDTFDEMHPVYLSNENCPLQHTISGEITGLQKTLAAAKLRQARTAKLLKVPVPSHCRLMQATVAALTPFINQITFHPTICPYLKNTDGRMTQDTEVIRQDLLENIAQPVQWNQMMDVAKEMGMNLTLEFPPGNTLTKLIHAKFGERSIRTINIDQHGVDDATFLYQKWR
ncbi:ACP S-malonyltransferase [Latilactobacillus graminis]|uniref:Malonyl CoA-acyl carrier protein transacylase n=2 Tax=Latilactobacillus graminis TaxID=60519 RepID=A0AA89KWV3_9LACO|nr:ACP S-malonyltransferase [Latilactobacillus graminis]KRM21977.1 acyl transferase region [Latilactobacillus graminis DSM 20719]QFP79665.1 ACP S-malonyltransferase [Latilactobacillus graminis]